MKGNFVALHEQTREYAFPTDRRTLVVRLRASAGARKACILVWWNRNRPEEGTFELPMTRFASDGMLDYFEAEVKTQKATRYINYYFKLLNGSQPAFLNCRGLHRDKPEEGFFEYSYTNDGDISIAPEWLFGSVLYQILPDRFYNGDASNDPEGTMPWGSTPTRENFMGGDLRGIIEKLPYLAELGADAVYLNPIFSAPSNHKYDTADYFRIDPAFGTEEDLAQLISLCHAKGIRVVLDGVFNHCGYDWPMFQDVLKHGRASSYSGWFYIDGYPLDEERLNYETIGYYKRMPKLRLSNEGARAHILNAAVHWMNAADIDGWRLDCAEEVERPFWQLFRRTLKARRNDCFLFGETWRENSDLMRGDQLDSVTNYALRDAMVDFFAKGCIDPAEFGRRVGRIIGAYSRTALHALVNVLGSHDTERFLTSCGGDTRKMMMAAAFQFGFPGVPLLYYGDEVGLQGGADPDCRKCMEWDKTKWNLALFNWYQMLIKLRHNHVALRAGAYKELYAGAAGGLYGFARVSENERISFLFNSSDKAVPMPARIIKDRKKACAAYSNYTGVESECLYPVPKKQCLMPCEVYVTVSKTQLFDSLA